MKAIKQFIFLSLLLAILQSCNNPEIYHESAAIIRSLDALPYPCNGVNVEIEGEIKEVSSFPDGVFQSLDNSLLPICVNLSWKEVACDENLSINKNLIDVNLLEIIDYTVETTNLESEYNCTNTLYQSIIDLYEDYTIIHSQDEFDNLVSGSCLPQIDFSMYDLVIGKKGLSNGILSVDYQLIKNGEGSNFLLRIQFNLNDTELAPNVTYHRLIPKLTNEQNLNVEIFTN